MTSAASVLVSPTPRKATATPRKKSKGSKDASSSPLPTVMHSTIVPPPPSPTPLHVLHNNVVTAGIGGGSGIVGVGEAEENVIVKLMFSQPGVDGGRSLPDAYNATRELDSQFASRPFTIDEGYEPPVVDCEGCASGSCAPLCTYATMGASSMCTPIIPMGLSSLAAPPPNLLQPPSIPPLGPIPMTPSTSTRAKVVRILAEFEEKGKGGEWPLSTSVHCYWCCHRFDTPPIGLPVKYVPKTDGHAAQGAHGGDRFQVIGCYCSLECACAHNFASTRESVDECMNRYSLLNALAARLGYGRSVVKPAPDRLALSIFGGHMSIDEFRGFVEQTAGQRQIVVNCPPMQSITQQVEEIGDADLSSEFRYVPLDSERVSRYQEKVRIQRTKPLVNFKNTLDHTMKLKYHN